MRYIAFLCFRCMLPQPFCNQERSAQIWSRHSFSGWLETRRHSLISSYYKILWSRLKGIKRDGALLHTHTLVCWCTNTEAEEAAQSGAIDSRIQVLCCQCNFQNQNQLIMMRPKPEATLDRRRELESKSLLPHMGSQKEKKLRDIEGSQIKKNPSSLPATASPTELVARSRSRGSVANATSSREAHGNQAMWSDPAAL